MATLNLVQEQKTSAPSAPRLRVAGDELFPELARITCRVCEREERVPLDHPALLCSACLADLSTTARRVADDYATTMAAFFQASAALAAATQGNAWYAKTEAARATIEPAVFQRAWAAAKSEGGEKARLIVLRERMDETAEMMRRAELRYIAAAPELQAARNAHGEPVGI